MNLDSAARYGICNALPPPPGLKTWTGWWVGGIRPWFNHAWFLLHGQPPVFIFIQQTYSAEVILDPPCGDKWWVGYLFFGWNTTKLQTLTWKNIPNISQPFFPKFVAKICILSDFDLFLLSRCFVRKLNCQSCFLGIHALTIIFWHAPPGWTALFFCKGVRSFHTFPLLLCVGGHTLQFTV